MELPHLTLFLRRLSAAPAPDAGLRETLRTPRVKYLLTCLLWTLIALAGMVNWDALAPALSGFGWFYGLNDLLVNAVTFTGNYWFIC